MKFAENTSKSFQFLGISTTMPALNVKEGKSNTSSWYKRVGQIPFFLTTGRLKRTLFCPFVFSRDTFVTILAHLHTQLETHASYFLLRNHI